MQDREQGQHTQQQGEDQAVLHLGNGDQFERKRRICEHQAPHQAMGKERNNTPRLLARKYSGEVKSSLGGPT